MFYALGKLAKAAVGVVIEVPLAVTADVVTLGGALKDTKKPYTATAISKIVKNVQESTR